MTAAAYDAASRQAYDAQMPKYDARIAKRSAKQ
jgi:hypothetical protein